jgi:hypothetical protein
MAIGAKLFKTGIVPNRSSPCHAPVSLQSYRISRRQAINRKAAEAPHDRPAIRNSD